MLKKYIFLIISATILVAIYGCHAGGNAPFINRNEDVQTTSKTAEVIDDGTFPDIILPSGAIIRCTQKYTLKPGTTLTATEHKVPVDSNSANSMTTYLYSLTGSLKSDNPLESAVSVNTVEKPISVTIPNNISNSGVCYLGLRNIESDSWSYSLATDDSQTNIKSLRLATTPNVCSFNLFRLGVQFRLFVFSNEEMKNQICFDSVTLKQEQPVKTKDEKYISNLSVLINIEGENLNSINIEDIITKIIYRSKNLKPAKIDFTKNPIDSSDGAVTGDYEHSFEITNLKLSNSLGNKAELAFELNLNGVSQSEFPTNFLIEFSSKGSDKATLPFSYTQNFTFETEEQTDDPEPGPQPGPQLDTYTITLDPNGGTLDNTTIEFTVETDDFNLPTPDRTGYTFLGWTGSNGDTPQNTVSIEKGSTGDRSYKANWQQNAPNTYTLTLVAGTGIASVDENKAYKANESITLNFTLKDGYEFDKWTDSAGNAVTSPFTMPAKAVTLTANSKVITYNLEYLIDGGYFEKDNPKTYTVETDSFDLSNPKKDGYTFLGWTGSNGDTPQNTVFIEKGSTGDRSYKANWKQNAPDEYTLNLGKGDGIATVSGNGAYKAGENITASCTMLAGYEFDKWTGDFTTETITMPAKDVTMTANAKLITYNITYDLAGGSLGNGVSNPTTYNVESDNLTLNNPTRTGCEFLGWTYEGQTTPTKTMTIAKGSIGDKTFTAHFKFSITFTITPDDGVIIDDVNNLYYTKPTFTVTISPNIALTAAEKENLMSVIQIKDSEDSDFGNATATWNNDGNIALSFGKDLTASTTYTMTLSFGNIENITTSCSPFTFKTFYFKGKGATDNRYQIESAEQLDYVRNYLDKHYIQTADINLGAYTTYWKPIGVETNPFIGSYNGDGKLIKNLTIHTSENVTFLGLFGYVGDTDKTAEIASITVDGVSIRGDNANEPLYASCKVGIIAYSLNGVNSSIKNCVVTNSSSSNSEVIGRFIGGICYKSFGGNSIIQKCKVENCDFKCSKQDNYIDIAGICYSSEGCIFDSCHVENVNISCSNSYIHEHVGGICFNGDSTVKDCSVKNTSIICETTDHGCEMKICGICEGNQASVYGCSLSNTTIKAVSPNLCLVGGICCNIFGSGKDLQNSYVENSVLTASGTQGYIGGILGMGVSGKITSCHVEGTKIWAEDLDDYSYFDIGGIIGESGYNNEVSKCYVSDSEIKGDGCKSHVGGIVGKSSDESSSVFGCYVLNSNIIDNTNFRTGGIVAYNFGRLSCSYLLNSSVTGGTDSNIGGIVGENCGNLKSSYLLNSSITGGSSSRVGGIVGENTSNSSLSSSYVFEDSIGRITAGDNSKLGSLVGNTYISVKDCFYNKTDLGLIGNSENNVTSPYCYSDVNSSTAFSNQDWSDTNAWSDYKTVDSNWPLDLTYNQRPQNP